MRIILVNYRYFVSGGPERYMFEVKRLLEGAGHEVVPFSVRYARNRPTRWDGFFADPIAGEDEVTFQEHTWTPGSVAMALRRSVYDREVHRRLAALIDQVQPDVALVLHFLRKLSPAVLTAFRDAGVPVVVRLSDYMLVCPEQHMLRAGRPCEECIDRGLWSSVRYRCIQRSLAASVVNYGASRYHTLRGYLEIVERFVTPSRFLRDEMVRGGWDGHRIVHIPTFVETSDVPATGDSSRDVVAYVGRVDAIKGADVLVDAFGLVKRDGAYPGIRLIMAGDDGSPDSERLRARVTAAGIPNVEWMGFLPRADVLKVLSRSAFSVVPSLCYDNLPNALLESWACGAPVLVSDVGSLRETIDGSGAGALFARGSASDLAAAMRRLLDDPAACRKMGERGRDAVARTYAPAEHLARLSTVLEDAVAAGRPASPCPI